ncbi:MAG TPA: hypothetical protein ENJ79_05020 [Gammaproteobacteria bacterium]|nr:hypothetical protein [Gammaproteobacteria bacterium]
MNLPRSIKYAVRSVASWHMQGDRKNVLLKATARGGSTWVMEIIASQPGFRYYDEPFNIRRDNVRRTGLFRGWSELQPEHCDIDRVTDYLDALRDNRYRHMNPAPFRRHYRPITHRIVFKLHELEHAIGQIAARCDCRVLYLVRHPIPNSLSRAVVPRLELFLASDYYRDKYLGETRMQEIREVAEKGSRLQRFVVSWCFENYLPLRHAAEQGWATLSYEELLLNPARSCRYLADALDLPDMRRLLRSVGEPSSNITLSGQETLQIMRDPDQDARRRRLVTRWRDKVGREEEKSAMEVLQLFDIQAYRFDRLVPDADLLHFEDTVSRLEVDE